MAGELDDREHLSRHNPLPDPEGEGEGEPDAVHVHVDGEGRIDEAPGAPAPEGDVELPPGIVLDDDGLPQVEISQQPVVLLTGIGQHEGREWVTLTARTAFGEQTYFISPLFVEQVAASLMRTRDQIFARIKGIVPVENRLVVPGNPN